MRCACMYRVERVVTFSRVARAEGQEGSPCQGFRLYCSLALRLSFDSLDEVRNG